MYRAQNRLTTRISSFAFAFVAVVASFGLAVSPLASSTASAACSSSCVASMSLSPGSGTYNPGNTVTVSIYVNSGGQTVNAVQADFTYTSSRLQFQSINATGSAFAIDASSTGGGGSVSIARGNISAVSGSSLLVAKVNFTVLSGNDGTASLTLSGSSTVASSTTNQDILGTKSGASYTVATPVAPTPPPPTGGGTTTPPSSTPTPTTTTTPKPTTTTTTPKPTTTTTTPEATETPKTTDDVESPAETASPVVEDDKSVSAISPMVIIGAILGALALLSGGAFAIRYAMKNRRIAPVSAHVNIPDGPIVGSAYPQATSPHVDTSRFGSYDDTPRPAYTPTSEPSTPPEPAPAPEPTPTPPTDQPGPTEDRY